MAHTKTLTEPVATVVYAQHPVPSSPLARPWQVNVAGNAVDHFATKDEAVAAAAALNPPPDPGAPPPALPGVIKHPLAGAVAAALTPPILRPPDDDDDARGRLVSPSKKR